MATRWTPKRVSAFLLRTSIWLLPLVASVATAVAVAALLPPAVGSAHIFWWAIVLGSSAIVLIATDRLLRRALPLAALLDISLAFPHRPPSRYAVLRRVRSVDELQERVRAGEGDEAQAAADLLALVLALDEHDRATRGHSERVRLYAELLGEELDLSPADLDRLRWAALLHDIGKLTVPSRILNKEDELEGTEWDRLRRHPVEGAQLVEPIHDWLGPWVGAIEHHHERVDGTGYPHGLRTDEIALGARIVAVVDAFETMTAARSYKRPLTIATARRELVASTGTHFDADIVRAFLNLSVPRLRHVAGWGAWIASMPGLALLRRLPRTAGNGVVAAATVGVLAVTGTVGPTPLPETTPGAGLAQPPGDTPGSASDDGTGETADDATVHTGDGTGDVTNDDGGPDAMDDRPADEGASPDEGTQPGRSVSPDRSGGDTPGGDPTPGQPTDGEPADSGSDAGGSDEGGSDDPAPTHRRTRQVGQDDATVLRTLYLHTAPTDGDLRHDVLPLDSRAPERTSLINYDRDVDDEPGLRLRVSDRGRGEDRVTHRQRWAVDLGAPTVLAGRLTLTVWATTAGATGSRIAVDMYVEHCTVTFTDCQAISDGTATTQATPGTWREVALDLPLSEAVLLDDRVLIVTLVAGPSSDADVLVAFDTTRYPAILETSVGVIASPQLPTTAQRVHGTDR